MILARNGTKISSVHIVCPICWEYCQKYNYKPNTLIFLTTLEEVCTKCCKSTILMWWEWPEGKFRQSYSPIYKLWLGGNGHEELGLGCEDWSKAQYSWLFYYFLKKHYTALYVYTYELPLNLTLREVNNLYETIRFLCESSSTGNKYMCIIFFFFFVKCQ